MLPFNNNKKKMFTKWFTDHRQINDFLSPEGSRAKKKHQWTASRKDIESGELLWQDRNPLKLKGIHHLKHDANITDGLVNTNAIN